VDARTGLPLKFTLTPASGGAAVVDVGFTQVSFAEPAASTFDFTPPKGAKVTEGDDAATTASGGSASGGRDEGLTGLEGLRDLQGLKTVGEGWTTIAEFGTGGEGIPSSSSGDSAVSGLLGSFGDKVTGTFGSGTVFSTRLVNALITDDGKVYAGAVTKDALVKAAEAAQ
jgi:hypothetical protein